MSEQNGTLFWALATLALIGGCIVVLFVSAGRYHRRRQRELHDEIRRLGLVEDAAAAGNGWAFLARGTWRGVGLAVGERRHSRPTVDGNEAFMVLELSATVRSDLGKYSILSKFTNAPHLRPPDVIRTGDSEIDMRFAITRLTAGGGDGATPTGDPTVSSGPVPWLDERVRAFLRKSEDLEQVLTNGSEIVVLVRQCGGEAFRNLIEMILYLARWPNGSDQAYR